MTIPQYWKPAKPAKLTKPRAKPRDLEGPVQRAVIKAIETCAPDVFVAHIPNGGKRSAVVAARLKRDGVKRGVPDLLLLWPRGEHGDVAFIEVKKDAKAKLSDEQLRFSAMCFLFGIKHAVVHDPATIPQLMEDWGAR